MAMVKKPSRGRQRIEIKRIVKEDSRQVTFSKRRGGLFKKASELCILCGAEVAIIVFSPAGKAFSFGHPSVETIIDRFLTQNPTLDYGLSLVDAHRGVNVRGLNRQYTEVENQLDMEKKKGEKLLKMRKDSKEECWWESPIETLSLDQLERLRSSLGELKKNVANRADELLVENSMPSFFGTNQMDLVNSFSSINSMGMTNSVGIADEFEPKVMVNNTTMASQSYGFGFRGHGFY